MTTVTVLTGVGSRGGAGGCSLPNFTTRGLSPPNIFVVRGVKNHSSDCSHSRMTQRLIQSFVGPPVPWQTVTSQSKLMLYTVATAYSTATWQRDKWACQWLGCVVSDKLLTFVRTCYCTKTDEDSSQEAPSTEPVANSPPQAAAAALTMTRSRGARYPGVCVCKQPLIELFWQI